MIKVGYILSIINFYIDPVLVYRYVDGMNKIPKRCSMEYSKLNLEYFTLLLMRIWIQ